MGSVTVVLCGIFSLQGAGSWALNLLCSSRISGMGFRLSGVEGNSGSGPRYLVNVGTFSGKWKLSGRVL